MYEKEAIVLKNVIKYYGKNFKVLDGLNLTVAKGSIYGLLGPSGCGKTTLLSCIVGIRKIDSGDVWVLGGKPGTKNSGIPGPRVGFMPQDICLVDEFSVIGALNYFGRINGMEDDEIKKRYEDLKEILQLPPKNRLVKNTSGGQKRRISLAAALLHNPELLILDEPTVGLDPVLRDEIWKYLSRITQENGITVIITTHYIEEARQANKIGLMRLGKLLIESTPDQLLDRFQCDNLEEAFLKLSKDQEENVNRNVTHNSEMLQETEFVETLVHHPTNSSSIPAQPIKNLSTTSGRFKALIIKNMTQFLRRPSGIVFAAGFPIIQLTLFFYSFGHDPQNLKIGIFNEETGNCNFGQNTGNVVYTPDDYGGTCNVIDFSCQYLHNIKNITSEKIFYDSFSDMENNLRQGKLSGMLHFGKNFTEALQRRFESERYLENEEFEMGEIQVWLDMSNRQIGIFLKNELYKRYFETVQDVMKECNLSKKVANVPLNFEEPIFGILEQDFTSFSSPTYILTLCFFVATALTTTILISDKHEGIWERSLVQGVKTPEILISHFVVELMLIIVQVLIICTISFLYFGVKSKSSLVTIIGIVFLMGICGMTYGFTVSAFVNSHIFADFVVTGSFYPLILLSGFLWPIEGMPTAMRWISVFLPTTVPGISLRALMIKGLSISNPEVYIGFLVISVWTIILFCLCLYGLRRKF
ncbi:ABC transporter G family member 23 [Polistes fuscatus]|uniref:ABC transporter G family member 23 n=1 Tax=Polistes fuscatus TaxID=30207 RepID=UPI001CA99CB2|nr:ABC transporter G family member 23 [Polistes fuscatus]